MESCYDVVVVGAGMIGGSVAKHVARLGGGSCRVAVIGAAEEGEPLSILEDTFCTLSFCRITSPVCHFCVLISRPFTFLLLSANVDCMPTFTFQNKIFPHGTEFNLTFCNIDELAEPLHGAWHDEARITRWEDDLSADPSSEY